MRYFTVLGGFVSARPLRPLYRTAARSARHVV